ncbi:hypothetical protein MMC25_004252 [Agyrium rufum]|nr:hypothetical protein [Agyrium rufum]
MDGMPHSIRQHSFRHPYVEDALDEDDLTDLSHVQSASTDGMVGLNGTTLTNLSSSNQQYQDGLEFYSHYGRNPHTSTLTENNPRVNSDALRGKVLPRSSTKTDNRTNLTNMEKSASPTKGFLRSFARLKVGNKQRQIPVESRDDAARMHISGVPIPHSAARQPFHRSQQSYSSIPGPPSPEEYRHFNYESHFGISPSRDYAPTQPRPVRPDLSTSHQSFARHSMYGVPSSAPSAPFSEHHYPPTDYAIYETMTSLPPQEPAESYYHGQHHSTHWQEPSPSLQYQHDTFSLQSDATLWDFPPAAGSYHQPSPMYAGNDTMPWDPNRRVHDSALYGRRRPFTYEDDEYFYRQLAEEFVTAPTRTTKKVPALEHTRPPIRHAQTTDPTDRARYNLLDGNQETRRANRRSTVGKEGLETVTPGRTSGVRRSTTTSHANRHSFHSDMAVPDKEATMEAYIAESTAKAGPPHPTIDEVKAHNNRKNIKPKASNAETKVSGASRASVHSNNSNTSKNAKALKERRRSGIIGNENTGFNVEFSADSSFQVHIPGGSAQNVVVQSDSKKPGVMSMSINQDSENLREDRGSRIARVESARRSGEAPRETQYNSQYNYPVPPSRGSRYRRESQYHVDRDRAESRLGRTNSRTEGEPIRTVESSRAGRQSASTRPPSYDGHRRRDDSVSSRQEMPPPPRPRRDGSRTGEASKPSTEPLRRSESGASRRDVPRMTGDENTSSRDTRRDMPPRPVPLERLPSRTSGTATPTTANRRIPPKVEIHSPMALNTASSPTRKQTSRSPSPRKEIGRDLQERLELQVERQRRRDAADASENMKRMAAKARRVRAQSLNVSERKPLPGTSYDWQDVLGPNYHKS